MMIAVNYTQFRENMKTNLDLVTDDYETIIVTRKDNRNVVVISEAAYNNLLENIYIMKDKGYYDRLMESKRQLESGRVTKHDLVEVSND
jgi:antitoxin YefM